LVVQHEAQKSLNFPEKLPWFRSSHPSGLWSVGSYPSTELQIAAHWVFTDFKLSMNLFLVIQSLEKTRTFQSMMSMLQTQATETVSWSISQFPNFPIFQFLFLFFVGRDNEQGGWVGQRVG
jgi:hypothetical protein